MGDGVARMERRAPLHRHGAGAIAKAWNDDDFAKHVHRHDDAPAIAAGVTAAARCARSTSASVRCCCWLRYTAHRAVSTGHHWWRARGVGLLGVLTAPLLHGSAAHLAANAVALLILGTLAGSVYPRATPAHAARRWGPGWAQAGDPAHTIWVPAASPTD
jgi:hypothetical protein